MNEEKTAKQLMLEWRQGRTWSWIAKELPCNRTTLWGWFVGGQPSKVFRHRIEDVTGGAVPADIPWEKEQ